MERPRSQNSRTCWRTGAGGARGDGHDWEVVTYGDAEGGGAGLWGNQLFGFKHGRSNCLSHPNPSRNSGLPMEMNLAFRKESKLGIEECTLSAGVNECKHLGWWSALVGRKWQKLN